MRVDGIGARSLQESEPPSPNRIEFVPVARYSRAYTFAAPRAMCPFRMAKKSGGRGGLVRRLTPKLHIRHVPCQSDDIHGILLDGLERSPTFRANRSCIRSVVECVPAKKAGNQTDK